MYESFISIYPICIQHSIVPEPQITDFYASSIAFNAVHKFHSKSLGINHAKSSSCQRKLAAYQACNIKPPASIHTLQMNDFAVI